MSEWLSNRIRVVGCIATKPPRPATRSYRASFLQPAGDRVGTRPELASSAGGGELSDGARGAPPRCCCAHGYVAPSSSFGFSFAAPQGLLRHLRYRLPTHALALTGTPSFSAHNGRSDMIRSMVSLAIYGCSTTISSCTVKTIG